MKINICMLKTPINLTCDSEINPLGTTNIRPVFSYTLNSSYKDVIQSSYQIVASSSMEFMNNHNYDVWDSGIISSNKSQFIDYEGIKLKSKMIVFWRVRSFDNNSIPTSFSEIAFFEMGLLEGDWNAKWITSDITSSAPVFCKKFELKRECTIKSARLYITGLGYFTAYLNNNRVGNDYFSPVVSDYDDRDLNNILIPFHNKTKKSIYYLTYDIKSSLVSSSNVLNVVLGNGWYNHNEKTVEGDYSYGLPKTIFEIHIVYDDNTTQIVLSDEKTAVSNSPIISNTLFKGEEYDFRKEEDTIFFNFENETVSQCSLVENKPKGELIGQIIACDRITKKINHIKQWKVDNKITYDFGQNFTGFVSIAASGKAGDVITAVFGENIDNDNKIDTLSTSWGIQVQTDKIILNGNGINTFIPHFTWHGFRYCELELSCGTVDIKEIHALVLHNDIKTDGEFICSNELFNSIQKNYIWTQLSNMHGGIPSDCPHRERRGYTGDGQVTAESAIYNFNVNSFYQKWIKDICDSQDMKTGYIPHTAPFSGGGGGPGWGSACVILPNLLYAYYGDINILIKTVSTMKKWVDYLDTRHDGDYIINREEAGWCIGDWCNPRKMELDESLINTYFFGYCAELLSRTFNILRLENESDYYKKLYAKIGNSFNMNFFNNARKQYGNGKQGADTIPFYWGIVADDEKLNIMDSIIHNLMIDNNGHFDTGIFATPMTLDVLTTNGHSEELYEILNKEDYPSYGYMIKSGATTIWEFWEKETGPSYAAKNGEKMEGYFTSHNHPMLGSISAWFYKRIAGLNLDGIGSNRYIKIKPYVMGDLKFAKAHKETIFGLASVSWNIVNNEFLLECIIPVGCRAGIFIPYFENMKAFEISDNKKIPIMNRDDDCFSIEVGSGKYNFIVSEDE